MTQETKSVFLERRAYRQRRMADAARVLPVIGSVLLCFPLLWARSDTEAMPTSYVMTFLFVVWLGLIVIAALISSRLPQNLEHQDPSGEE